MVRLNRKVSQVEYIEYKLGDHHYHAYYQPSSHGPGSIVELKDLSLIRDGSQLTDSVFSFYWLN